MPSSASLPRRLDLPPLAPLEIPTADRQVMHLIRPIPSGSRVWEVLIAEDGAQPTLKLAYWLEENVIGK